MTKKVYEMNQKADEMKAEVQSLLDDGKLEEAKAKMQDLRAFKESIEIQEELEKEEEARLAEGAKNKLGAENKEKSANIIRAMLKKATGHGLTEAENSLLLPTTSQTTGANGEAYILPEDVRTTIQKKVREYRSLREVTGYMPVSALTGSFPVENFETLSGLVDFADGTDGEDNKEIKFTSVQFALKEKAAFIKLSNTLINLSDENLIEYIAEVFAKKAVITENKMAVDVLKSNKTKKALADWKELKASINKDLDPAALNGMAIVTNQDGYNVLDSALDTVGRPILQPNPTNPTEKLFMGYKVEVFSNSVMPSETGKAPIFYGNLKEGVKFTDLSGSIAFATSSEAGFMSNTTIARLIEFIDVVQCDSSDKCYVYGELAVGEE